MFRKLPIHFECEATRPRPMPCFYISSSSLFPSLLNLLPIILVSWLIISLAPSISLGQRRDKKPTLQKPNHDQFAGRVMLIPLDSRPSSWQLPRQIARIADHEIIAPLRSQLGSADKPADIELINRWAKNQNYGEINGVIVSLNMLAFGGAQASSPDSALLKERLSLIEWIRTQHPRIPLYAFTTAQNKTDADTNNQTLNQLAIDLTTKGVIDYLIIQQPEGTRAEIEKRIEEQKLNDRVTIESPTEEVAVTLIARYLNNSYQRPLKVLPIYAESSETTSAVSQAIDTQLAASNGTRIKINFEEAPLIAVARRADVLLFIYPAKASETDSQAIIDNIVRTVSSGSYVAVVDLSEPADDRLIRELRQRKMLDLLVAYAGSGDVSRDIGLTLAQSSARIVGAKFLRDDIDRLQRIERAQVEAIFSRYLLDWGYSKKIRPLLELHVREVLKADPKNLADSVEKAEQFAYSEISTLAEGLFNEQFRRNIHSVLLADAGRVEFRLDAVQRFQFRLPWKSTEVPEIFPRIYVALYNFPSSYLNK